MVYSLDMKDWDEILFTYDEMEAQIVKTLLETEGIEVSMDSSKLRPFPVSVGRMGEIKLLVRNVDLERAMEIIKTMKGENQDRG
jgi:hypothetical protein